MVGKRPGWEQSPHLWAGENRPRQRKHRRLGWITLGWGRARGWRLLARGLPFIEEGWEAIAEGCGWAGFRLEVPLAIQIGAVVVLFAAALGTLWYTSSAVVEREERRRAPTTA